MALVTLVATVALATGCIERRSFPEPAQMCEDLVSVCGEPVVWDFAGLRECYDIGRAGQEDARQEDQCFAVYDECISDCRYYAFWASFGDAGLGDAAAGDSEQSDAGAADASTLRDE